MRPSDLRTSCTIEMSFDDSFKYNTTDRTTPKPTATWIGSTSVEMNVVAAASTDGHPARQTDRTSDGSILRMPARIRRAPSPGITTCPMTSGTPITIAAIQIPEEIAAHRLAAPEDTLTAVPEREPPTGRPR